MERLIRAEAQVPAIPENPGDGDRPQALGVVVLPVRWSGSERRYDLSVRRDRARIYEQVLREGTEEDIREFIDVDELVDLWDELVIPRHVGRAWAGWLEGHRGIVVSC